MFHDDANVCADTNLQDPLTPHNGIECQGAHEVIPNHQSQGEESWPFLSGLPQRKSLQFSPTGPYKKQEDQATSNVAVPHCSLLQSIECHNNTHITMLP